MNVLQRFGRRALVVGTITASIFIGTLAAASARADVSEPPSSAGPSDAAPAGDLPALDEPPDNEPAQPTPPAEPAPTEPQPTDTPADPAAPAPAVPLAPAPEAEPAPEPEEPVEGAAEPQTTTPPAQPTAEADEAVGVLALPPTTSDAAQVAWTGTGPEPATKLTVQQALNAAGDAGTVSLVPSAAGYRFASVLTVPTSVTIAAATPTAIYGRMTLNGGGLTLSSVALTAAGNSQTQLTVNAAGATLNGITVQNPEGFTGTTALSLTTGADNVTLLNPVISNAATGVNLTFTGGTTITGGSITGATTGILAAPASTALGPHITGTAIGFTSKGVVLGSAASAVLSGLTLTGPGAGTTFGVDYLTSSAAAIIDVAISGVLHGISTSAPASTAVGPTISGGTITATGNAIGLGATRQPSVSGITLTRLEPTNTATAIGVNVLNATTGVTITDVIASGFRDGISVASANTASDLVIDGGSIAAVVNGITLGSSTAPTVTDITLVGQLRPAATVIATVGIELAAATGATITGLNGVDLARGVNAPITNGSAALSIAQSTITLTDAAGATGVNLGATTGASVSDVTVTGVTRTTSRTSGITTNRASGAVITDVTISQVATGIGAVWSRLFGTSIPGHQISGATITNTGIGIYTANTDGTTVTASTIDAYGEGVAGHEDANFSLTASQITGHAGSTFQNGTNCVRFYYTDGITIADVTTSGGATGLYLDMSSDVTATRLDLSQATWYGTYAESVTGYLLTDSRIYDNAGLGNLTINPTASDALDLRQVSSAIVFEDNEFTDNVAGLYLPLGAYDITFQRNTVRGTNTYVVLGNPIHNALFANNDVEYTHDPSLMATADLLADAPVLGSPAPEPPFPDTPSDTDIAVQPTPSMSADGIMTTMSATPPDNAVAAFWISSGWYNLDTDSASTSSIRVLDNGFSGDGPFVGVGTVSTIDRQSSDAPANPSAMRTLRDTVEVSRNVFPQNSTAIVTVDNAEQGLDGNADNNMINGNAAVDARGDNDWGSPCYARVPTDGYDGGGAYIHEIRVTQVLYPQGCAPSPPGPTPPPEPPEPLTPSSVSGAGSPASLAGTGGHAPQPWIAVAAALSVIAGLGLLAASRRVRADRSQRVP